MTVNEVEERQPLLKKIGDGRNRGGSFGPRTMVIEMEEAGSLDSGPGSRIKSEKHALTYSWKDINVNAVDTIKTRYSVRAKKEAEPSSLLGKQILRKVSGVIYPGELTVIMGSSGAGKTTLLNALTFCSQADTVVTGERLLNGYPADRSIMAALSAYVQQNELFLESLTVKEHLMFQAMLRMDKDIPRGRRASRVGEVISQFGLRNCENTTIRGSTSSSGISGGERKRLSFASEVLTDPPMMFCDEPTSGLDSVMALNIVSILKAMAQNGKTIACTIHQPSSEMYSMFDKIILLAEGRAAFLGTREEASNFFKDIGIPCPLKYNPADFYVQLLAVVPHKEDSSMDAIETICDSFERSAAGIRLTTDLGARHETQGQDPELKWNITRCSRYKANWTCQFRALIWRSWLCVIKDPMLVKMRLFQNIAVSLLICILYFRRGENNEDGVFNINGVIFTFLTNMTFQNVFSVITVFCSERPIFMKEHLSGMYRVDVYFLSKTLAEIPIFLALPVLFTVITYYTVGLNGGVDHFFLAIVIVVLVANVATSFGYLISSISGSTTMALSIGPPVIIPFLLFGGFLLNLRSIPSYFFWLSYLSWFRYGNEALLINQWSDIDEIQCRSPNSTCPRNGRLILEMYGFHSDRFPLDLLSLFSLVILFRLLAFLALLLRTIVQMKPAWSGFGTVVDEKDIPSHSCPRFEYTLPPINDSPVIQFE